MKATVEEKVKDLFTIHDPHTGKEMVDTCTMPDGRLRFRVKKGFKFSVLDNGKRLIIEKE